MNYYFPSILTGFNFTEKDLPDSFFTVNSGENAIRLLLRSFSLQPGSKVALPLFVCDSLKEAVLKEGLKPLYLDLKQGSFHADYNLETLSKEKPAATILVHLYGFIHPDTEAITKFCKEHTIKLIHDAAQSYGIDETKLSYSDGIVYSFGPGKSSTAAGGAIVTGLNKEFYSKNCKPVSGFSAQNIKAKLFLKSRLYGYEFSSADKLLQKIIFRFKIGDVITSMTTFQNAAANEAMRLVKDKAAERKMRYEVLEKVVKANRLLNIPYNDGAGLYFKIVINSTESGRFKQYLRSKNVPFFSLKEELLVAKEIHDQFPEFNKIGEGFVELSTEASLPMEEVKRVAEILRQFS